MLLDLTEITDDQVCTALEQAITNSEVGTDTWRALGSSLVLSKVFSFSNTRTYPRPDHPIPAKRKPLQFTLVGILVSYRTTLENEQRAMAKLMERFPDVDALRAATESELSQVIHVAGLADTKARRICAALKYIDEKLGNDFQRLTRLSVQEARGELLKVPGLGPKGADCFLSIGLGMSSIAVDVNVFRVASWVFGLPWSDKPDYANAQHVARTKAILDKAIPDNAFLCQVVHTLYLLYGKSVGSKHPQFGRCLLRDFCLSCDSQTKSFLSFDHPSE